MGKRRQPLRHFSFITVLGILFLGACASDPETEKPQAKPREIQTDISVSSEVNPDIDGRPSPIVVRIYELKNLGKFEVGDFFKLFEEYDAFLGGDLVASKLFHLQPGDKKTLKHPVAAETNYIAVTAAYRDLNRAVWRAAKPLEADLSSRIEITLDALAVGIKNIK